MELEDKIRIAIMESGKTYGQVAKEFGTSQSSLTQRLARGKFRKRELEKLAEICGFEYYCGYEIDGEYVE